MRRYADDLKIKDALQIYFSHYHFKDGGYNDKFFKIKLGKFYIPFPNIKARVDAVKIHDIHHIVTEYTAVYKGEAEIGGWEIASGCGRFWVGWILNLGSFMIGLLFYQRPLFNAFMAGRKVKTNLCYNTTYDDVLLNKTVGELRNQIGVSVTRKNTLADYLMFVSWSAVSIVYHAAVLCVFIFVVCKILTLFFGFNL